MKDNIIYNPVAHLYEDFTNSAPQAKIIIRTILNLAGDIQGKSVLDLACGYGLYSWLFKSHGASRVVGVDISDKMIELAKKKSQQDGDNIEFHIRDVCTMESFGKFDLIVAAWLLHYSESVEKLEMMFQSIANNLSPSGKLISYICSPDYRLAKGNCKKYHLNILSEEPWQNGLRHKVELMSTPPISFTMYRWSREQYQEASRKAGLKLEWHEPMLLQSDIDSYPSHFWDDYKNNCFETPFVCYF
ncbi:class I SAM-dependent DNA methyltransferase [Xenorhabdus cabanillasii]|uniref:Methyltransferase family protein n=2 Tax=Xenorhabdus cabanillasii TaxID=351673 RepID=A0A3D9UJ35_9GAMM|nr:class I SAM-dependent methyltransferase [Xenorhabdus cabanillasii]PHM76444.1 type 11 methyltransferase [Xenorhabdus cabanillasii JM26]REF27960.1 methyltransferase family protein [Xenorhabdus cabanillasii]CDL86287.1 conserved hypothetical protein [Xenorhabdus cabanillasii JM26]